MTIDSDSLRVANRSSDPQSRIGLHPLQQVSARIGEFRDGRSKLRAKDLVGLLLCHGARAWRSSQPVACVRIKAVTPEQRPAVRLSLGSNR